MFVCNAVEAAALAFAKCQVQALLNDERPALAQVQHFSIDVPWTGICKGEFTPASQAITATLVLLATACPRLQQLSVKGFLGFEFFALIGSCCPDLTCVAISFGSLPTQTVQRLTTLLPHLTSLSDLDPVRPDREVWKKVFNESKEDEEEPDLLEQALCTALRAGHGLTHVDLGSVPLTKEIWDSLPVGLCSLCCLCSSLGPHFVMFGERRKPFVMYPDSKTMSRSKKSWQRHMSLKSLELTGSSLGESIETIEGLLDAAPHVRKVHLRHTKVIEVQFSLRTGRYLQSMDRRMDPLEQGMHQPVSITGQEATKTSSASTGHANRIGLLFRIPKTPAYAHPNATANTMSSFLTNLADTPLSNFTEVTFANSSDKQPADLANLPRLLPNVVELSVHRMGMGPSDVRAFASCASLQRLELWDVDGFSESELEQLCTQSRSLRCVSLHGCTGFVRPSGREAPLVEVRKSASKVVSIRIDHARCK